MKLITLIAVIVIPICITTGNLITLDGKCPFESLKPTPIALIPVLKGKFNSIAETTMGDINRTDITAVLKQTEANTVKITLEFRSKENGECEEFVILANGTETPGVFNASYQVAPNTNFVEYKIYFLSLQLLKLRAIGIICHNLPDQKYQVELAVLSAVTTEFDEEQKDYVKDILDTNGISFLYQYIVPIERNKKCKIPITEVVDSFIPIL